MSADGSRLAAMWAPAYPPAGRYNLFMSSDFGETWQTRVSSGLVLNGCLAVTRNLQHIFVADSNRASYLIASHDFGASFVNTSFVPGNGGCVSALSDSGSVLVSAVYNGNVQISTNGGANWTLGDSGAVRQWGPVVVSSDGTIIVVAVDQGAIFLSINSGGSFSAVAGTELPNTVHWRSLALNPTGQYILALNVFGNSFVSNNFGTSFASVLPYGNWQGAAVSNSGQVMVASCQSNNPDGYNYVWTSNDFGSTWTPHSNTVGPFWTGTAVSASGYFMAASATSQTGQTWGLFLSSS
jgi:hypothetical protein